MKKLALATTALTLLAGTAAAQDMPENQTGSQWYTDAQAHIQAMLDRQPNTGTASNVMLFVADGQGITTNYAARLFQEQARAASVMTSCSRRRPFPTSR